MSLGSTAAKPRAPKARLQNSGARRNQNPRRSAAEKAMKSRNFAERVRREQVRRLADAEAANPSSRRDPTYQLERLGFLQVPRVCPACGGHLKRQSCNDRGSMLYRCIKQHCRKRLCLQDLWGGLALWQGEGGGGLGGGGLVGSGWGALGVPLPKKKGGEEKKGEAPRPESPGMGPSHRTSRTVEYQI